jgi:hypothetical protein
MQFTFRYLFSLFIVVCISIQGFGQSTEIQVRLLGGYPSRSLKTAIETNVSKLLNEINRAYLERSLPDFDHIALNEYAAESIHTFWRSSQFYCVSEEIKKNLNKISDEYELRDIPIFINNEYREIFVTLDKKGVITNWFFSVPEHHYINIGNKVIDETRKNIIHNFLESLKTAYIRKNIKFIDDVYSDKALIIVGRTIQKTDRNSLQLRDTGKQSLYSSGSDTQYKKMTKPEYLERLAANFRNNKDIFVDFKDIHIWQHEKAGYESFYGVRLNQIWQSSSYGDNGILFFVIQFRENDHPLIWVRVWQDLEKTSKSEQIGFGDIKIKPE